MSIIEDYYGSLIVWSFYEMSMDYNDLWSFVGEELYLIIPDKKLFLNMSEKVVVIDLNEDEFERYFINILTVPKDGVNVTFSEIKEQESYWEAHEGEFDLLSDLDRFKEESDCMVFCRKIVEKIDVNTLDELDQMVIFIMFPFNSDTVIPISNGMQTFVIASMGYSSVIVIAAWVVK